MDGALGSRGAWLLQPYSDKPDSRGLNTNSIASIKETAQLAIDHYEEAFKKDNRMAKALRWRIEHAQHLSAADIPRFGQLGVIASMRALHATSHAVFVGLGSATSEPKRVRLMTNASPCRRVGDPLRIRGLWVVEDLRVTQTCHLFFDG